MPHERPWQSEEDLKKTYTDKLWDNEEDWTAAKDIDDSEADDWDLPEISDEIDPDEEGQDINFYGKEPEKHSAMPENENHPEHTRTPGEQEGNLRPVYSSSAASAHSVSQNAPDSRRHEEQEPAQLCLRLPAVYGGCACGFVLRGHAGSVWRCAGPRVRKAAEVHVPRRAAQPAARKYRMRQNIFYGQHTHF